MATETKSSTALETFAREDRTFPPPKGFAAQANAKDPAIYEHAEKDLEGFWAEQAWTPWPAKPWLRPLGFLPSSRLSRMPNRRPATPTTAI